MTSSWPILEAIQSILPSCIFNLFFHPPSYYYARRNRFRLPKDTIPLAPDRKISDFERAPLTRPSSPRPSTSGSSHASASLLSTLPLEIRRQIWEETIGGRTIHLGFAEPYEPGVPWSPYYHQSPPYQRKQIFGGWECPLPDPISCNGACSYPEVRSKAGVEKKKKQVLPLLLTNRQIYREVIDILYSSNTFVTSVANLMHFFPAVLLPQRINAIHSLRFTWTFKEGPPLGRPSHIEIDNETNSTYEIEHWEREDIRRDSWKTIWRNIAAMENLRDLNVRLDVSMPWIWLDLDRVEELILPIKAVTKPDIFVITLPHRSINHPLLVERWEELDSWDKPPCIIERKDSITRY